MMNNGFILSAPHLHKIYEYSPQKITDSQVQTALLYGHIDHRGLIIVNVNTISGECTPTHIVRLWVYLILLWQTILNLLPRIIICSGALCWCLLHHCVIRLLAAGYIIRSVHCKFFFKCMPWWKMFMAMPQLQTIHYFTSHITLFRNIPPPYYVKNEIYISVYVSIRYVIWYQCTNLRWRKGKY